MKNAVVSRSQWLEARRAFIQAEWCRAGFFEETPRDTIQSLEREQDELGPQIDRLMGEWEAVEAEIATLAAEKA